MDRIVLLRDVSPELPNNTSSAFKGRLGHPVQFRGDWEVGLTYVSMSDQGLNLKELLDPNNDALVTHTYHFNAAKKLYKTNTVHRNDVLQNRRRGQFHESPPLLNRLAIDPYVSEHRQRVRDRWETGDVLLGRRRGGA